jgi:hypothetical protein
MDQGRIGRMAKLVALAAKYKIDILGPLPEEVDVRP